jgi:hypothetical protein
MKTSSLRVALGLCAAGALFTGSSASAAPVNFNGSFSDNFSEMTATQTTAPAGWSVVSESGANSTFAPAGSATVGVAPNFTSGTALVPETTLIAATLAQTTTSDNTTGTTVKGVQGINFNNSLATAQNGEGARSLGTDPSGNAATILELSLTNTTASAINSLNIGYDIDRFTTTANDNNATTGNNIGVEELPGYQLFYSLTPSVASSWVNVSSLNPTVDAGTTGAVAVPNTVGITTVSPTTVTLNSAWGQGSTLALAWFDDNAESPSPDQNIGLNNVVVAAVPEPASGFLGLVAVGAAFTLLRLRRRA